MSFGASAACPHTETLLRTDGAGPADAVLLEPDVDEWTDTGEEQQLTSPDLVLGPNKPAVIDDFLVSKWC